MEPLVMLSRLCKALDCQAKEVGEAEDWYEGEHPIPLPPPNTLAAHDQEARIAYERMARLGVMNFLPAIVDTPASKLRVEGIRMSTGDRQADADAWGIWQRNHLDADFDLGIKTALTTGSALALVWWDENQRAQVSLEHPKQAIVWYEAGSRRKRKAGLKRWIDDNGYLCATLYLPSWVYKYQSPVPESQMRSWKMANPNLPEWVQRKASADEPWPLPHGLGVVPLVEVRANGSLKPCPFGGGEPEFAGQINDQRRINKTVLDMLTTMEHQAYRQRWATGWGVPTNEDGTPDKHLTLKASAASLMIFEDPDVKVGEFSQADFTPFLTAIDRWVKAIATTSRTPPYAFLLGDMVNVAADSLARIEGIQAAKVRNHARVFGEFAEEILRLALLVEQNPAAADVASSIVWGDFEERTATELAGLATTMRDLGVPDEDVFAVLPGVDQQTAARWAAHKAATDLLFPAAPVP